MNNWNLKSGMLFMWGKELIWILNQFWRKNSMRVRPNCASQWVMRVNMWAVNNQLSHTVMLQFGWQFKPLKLYSVVAAKNGEDANGLKLEKTG